MSKPLENYIIRIKSSIDQFDNEGVIREEDLLQRINHYQSRIRMLSEEFFLLKLQSLDVYKRQE